MKHLVDVVIPTYNSAAYLSQAIQSVLLQGDVVKHIYVIDDGSTDDTKVHISHLLAVNKKIVYVWQRNRGLSAARNEGVKRSTAPYVAFLDSDDVWHEGKLDLQLRKMKSSKYRNVGLIYCEYDDIDPEGNKLAGYGSFRLHKNIRGDVSKHLLECNYATGSGSGVLVKRACFKSVGLFDEELRACEDWDMWMRIAQKYSFDYVNKPLISLRRHKKSMQAHRRHMTLNTALLITKMLSAGLHVNENLIKDTKREILRHIIEHPWDIDFIRRISMTRHNSKTNFVVWKSPKEFGGDLIWVMYVRVRHIANFFARPIVFHVIPPFKTYIYKPLKRKFGKRR